MKLKVMSLSAILALALLVAGAEMIKTADAANQTTINRLTSVEIDKAKAFNQKMPAGYFAPMLTFHHVGPIPAGADKIEKNLHVLPADFDKMLKSLRAAKYQTVFASDMVGYLANDQKAPPKTVALTFDDGYADFYTYAFPLLQKYQMKASLYVIVGADGGRYLTSQQIKELDASGLVEIGSHTMSHPQLSKLPADKEFYELRRSKDLLDKLLNKDVQVVCYPYGDYNKTTEVLAKQAGYKYGLTYNHHPLRDSQDLFAIDRAGVWANMSIVKFLQNLDIKVK